jgi:hypothetical protein
MRHTSGKNPAASSSMARRRDTPTEYTFVLDSDDECVVDDDMPGYKRPCVSAVSTGCGGRMDLPGPPRQQQQRIIAVACSSGGNTAIDLTATATTAITLPICSSVAGGCGTEIYIDLCGTSPQGGTSDKFGPEEIDLTIDDATLTKAMQSAFDGEFYPDVQVIGSTAAAAAAAVCSTPVVDIVHRQRQDVRTFLARTAGQLEIEAVVPNEASLPGTPLYEHFKAAWESAADKSIRMVFHGTVRQMLCVWGLLFVFLFHDKHTHTHTHTHTHYLCLSLSLSLFL